MLQVELCLPKRYVKSPYPQDLRMQPYLETDIADIIS